MNTVPKQQAPEDKRATGHTYEEGLIKVKVLCNPKQSRNT